MGTIWRGVGGGKFAQRTPITVSVDGLDGLHLFATGMDSHVYTCAAETMDPWERVADLMGVSGSSETRLAAVAAADGHVRVFATGMTATMEYSRTDSTGWSAAAPVVPGGGFKAATAITTVCDPQAWRWWYVFGVGEDNRLYYAYHSASQPGDATQGWFPVLDGRFSYATPVAAVSCEPNWIDLYAVGEDGTVYTAANRTDPPKWIGWNPLRGAAFAQETVIAAVSSRQGFIDVFGVGADGKAYTASWHGGSWQSFTPLPGGGAFTPGTPISAVSLKPGWIDLFAVGGNGLCYTNYTRNGPWSGWTPLMQGGFTQKTPITALAHDQQIHLFGVGTDGACYTATRNPEVYSFALPEIDAVEIRSRALESDTDYASFGVKVLGGASFSKQVLVDDSVHSGSHWYPAGLAGELSVCGTDVVVITYSVINSGAKQPSDALKALESAGEQIFAAAEKADIKALSDAAGVDLSGLSPREQGAIIGAQLGNVVLPGIGIVVGALAGWFADNIGGWLFGSYDGQVASAIYVYSGVQLQRLAYDGHKQQDANVLESPDSHYDIHWSIALSSANNPT